MNSQWSTYMHVHDPSIAAVMPCFTPLTNTPVVVDEAVATALESSTSVALEE